MSTSLLLRPLSSADADQYRHLRLQALREHPQAFTSDADQESGRSLQWVQARLSDGQSRFFGAFVADQLVAMVGLEVSVRRKEAHVGHLVGMYVSSAQTGQGVGARLMGACLDYARQQGLEAIKLSVTASNQTAINLYRRHGFVLYGKEPRAICVNGEYFDKCLMRCDLHPTK